METWMASPGRMRTTLERQLRRSRRWFGEDAKITLNARIQLAKYYARHGYSTEALAVWRDALATIERRGQGGSETRWHVEFTIGRLYRELGRPEEALPVLVRVAEFFGQRFGEYDRRTVGARSWVGGTLRKLGDYESAVDVYRTVVASSTEALGGDAPATLDAMVSLIVCLGRCNEFAEARALLVTLLERRTRLLGADDPKTKWAESVLATYPE
jgi:tetratricopeptide (TPR) repeat protein